MNEHLGKWTRDEGDAAFRVDLWDTGETNAYGKSRLRYAFAIIPADTDVRPILFDGEDYSPGMGVAIDSDASAGGLLSFFYAYGEAIRWNNSDDVPEFTSRQRDALADHYEAIGLWSLELDPES